MSHSVQNQAWQKDAGSRQPDGSTGSMEGASDGNPSFETGDGVPSWTFKIEGKLLQVLFHTNYVSDESYDLLSDSLNPFQPQNDGQFHNENFRT